LHNNGVNGRTILSAGNALSSGEIYNQWRLGIRESNEGDLSFSHYNETTYRERVTFAASGNVGIGTTSPTHKLDVSGGIRVTSPIKLASYTVGTLPSAATEGAGATVYVSNAATAPCMAFSDGTNWKRCDNASTTVV
jgi:hypothetical protein